MNMLCCVPKMASRVRQTKTRIKNYNKNIHWLKMLKEHELSAVALQPSTDKNGIQNEYNIYRKGEIKRKIWIKAK